MDPLLQRAIEGDQEAFGELFLKHRTRVIRVCRKYVFTNEEAEELAQDTFILAYRHIKKFRGESQFGTWLHRIATNVGRMSKRKKRLVVVDGDQVEVLKVIPDEQPTIEFGTDRKLIERAFQKLPETYKPIFVMRFLQDTDLAEIARCLDISLPATKTRVLRTKTLFRERYEELCTQRL